MSKEIKKTEKPELPEQDLEKVAGGKTYNETRSNTTTYSPPVAIPKPPTTTPAKKAR